MISRTWHGLVPKEHAPGFERYLEQTGIKEAKELEGNIAAHYMKVEQGQYTHFFLCTLWSTWEAIIRYAGNTPSVAITYPEDARYGLISDPIVIHQEVNGSATPFPAMDHVENREQPYQE